MRRAVLQALGALSSYRYSVDSYDSTKLGLGPLIYQRSLSAANEDNFAGPAAVGLARPMEQATTIPSQFPWAMQWQNNTAGEVDWIFLADLAVAAATRRINAYTYNRRTSAFTWKGFVTVTFPGTSEAKTIRALRMTYDKESTGTVTVSGTGVTGASTLFATNGVCAGNRIGFGSTDPTQITTWYEVSSVTNDGALVLTGSAGTIGAGSAYVIEDLRCVLAMTSLTTTNGGLYVIKGLSFDQFSNVGGTVPAAVSTDNIRASYYLKDAATGTAIAAFGIGISARTSVSSQMAYMLETLASPVVFKINIRAALTVASGADTTAFQFKTGSGGALTGAPTQLNNGRLATLGHGPFSGAEAIYFTTASRIYSAPTSGVTTGSTTWLSAGAVMTENPPGGIATFAASGAMASLEYSSMLDKFIVATGATQRDYVTQYRTDGGQMDRLWGANTLQIDESTEDATATPLPSKSGGSYTVWSEGGMLYIATVGTTAATNRLYAIPFSADWEYASSTHCRLILPSISTPNANKYAAFVAQEAQVLGGKTGTNLGLTTEPWRMYYRTTGISDDSGSWTLLDGSGLAGIDAAASVQLMIEFRTIGTLCLPSRILNYGVIYDDTDSDNQWLSSDAASDETTATFGFYFVTAYGSTVPRLKLVVIDADSGATLFTDDSTTRAGTWSKSTTGPNSGYGAYNTTDRGNSTTYVRIQPNAISSNVKAIGYLRTY
jgi:hypothetical protein